MRRAHLIVVVAALSSRACSFALKGGEEEICRWLAAGAVSKDALCSSEREDCSQGFRSVCQERGGREGRGEWQAVAGMCVCAMVTHTVLEIGPTRLECASEVVTWHNHPPVAQRPAVYDMAMDVALCHNGECSLQCSRAELAEGVGC